MQTQAKPSINRDGMNSEHTIDTVASFLNLHKYLAPDLSQLLQIMHHRHLPLDPDLGTLSSLGLNSDLIDPEAIEIGVELAELVVVDGMVVEGEGSGDVEERVIDKVLRRKRRGRWRR